MTRPADHTNPYDQSPNRNPPMRPSKLYDTIARAHDTPDPSWTTHRPLRRSLSKAMKNPPVSPRWRPRQSSYEARRGTVGVTPSQVNTLVPYIPPIDAGMPPPSKEWLDAAAKRFLAAAQADVESAQRNTPNGADADPSTSSAKTDDDSDWNFYNDSDSDTLDSPVVAPPAQPPQAEPDTPSHVSESDHPWSDTDTDSDIASDDGYNWSTTRISESSPLALTDIPRWIIPRKRPSFDIIPNVTPSSPISSDAEQAGKRHRAGGKWAPTKQPKLYAHDTPTRQRYSSIPANSEQPSASTATSPAEVVLDLQHSPIIAPRTPKTFPCMLDGCAQICASAGDLERHQQSLRHRAPSYPCLACHKSYTRSDALKRHLNSKVTCKREHATKLSQASEASEEAVTLL